MRRTLLLTALLVLLPAGPALAAPSPSPTAPVHTGTGCAAVFAHNPQATEASRSAPQAQVNFFEVAAAFCGLGG